MNKKGQTEGLITGLIFGVASLVIGVIIAFVIVSTLSSANFFDSARTSAATTNETGGFINSTGYTLDGFDTDTTKGISITNIVNATDGDGTTIVVGNYTLDKTTGIITNATAVTYDSINVSYSISTESSQEKSVDDMTVNFSEGVDEISKKVPTVLLIAAIILILSVLAILIGVWQRMRMGGGAEL